MIHSRGTAASAKPSLTTVAARELRLSAAKLTYMRKPANEIYDRFNTNVATVRDLSNFDRTVVEVSVIGLNHLADRLAAEQRQSASISVRNYAKALENIRKNDSLRPKYFMMFNQCIVLLVSYFGSALHDLFISAVTLAFESGAKLPVRNEEIKLSWQGVSLDTPNLSALFADEVVKQRDISFQDMQSISRAFMNSFNVQVERTEHVNNIILAQAARHVIVHAGGIVDQRMLRQLASASPRTLKSNVTTGQSIVFAAEELEVAITSMNEYIRCIISALQKELTAGL